MVSERKWRRLEDKVAIITGGAHGLGRAYALAMAAEGARVVIPDLDLEGAQATAKDIQAGGGQALAVRTDVSDPEETQKMARLAVEEFGAIDILVNNAAYFVKTGISRVPFNELSVEEWDRVMAVNARGVFLCCRAVFPQMKAQKKGKIVNISSGVFFTARGPYVHYIASKGAVIGITRALAREMGDYNINVNCVCPGSTFTEDPSDQAALVRRQAAANRRPLKRIEYPEDVIGTIIFLASEDSNFITGQTIGVNGGDWMR